MLSESHTKLDIVTLNRRHRGVYQSLLVCSQPNVESMGDLLDVMIADKVQPTICRGLLIALARRLKKKVVALIILGFMLSRYIGRLMLLK